MGAAGRDFHNFNTVYRHDPHSEVVAFTATQIPDIAGRRYPASLAGPRYPSGIPIVEESPVAGSEPSRIPSGAIFGLDNLKVGRIGGIDRIRLRTTKPPRAFKRKLSERTCLFDGDAAECVNAYPKNVNVAAAISLAADKTVHIELWADPEATSQLAAFSVLTLLQESEKHLLVGN